MSHILFYVKKSCIFCRKRETLTILSRWISGQSHYEVLKVSPSSSSKEIRDAFIILSKKLHPDRGGNSRELHEKFVQINEAYSTLINPSKRRAYDLTLHQKPKLGPSYTSHSSNSGTSYAETFHRGQEGARSWRTEENYNHFKDPFSWAHQERERANKGGDAGNRRSSEWRRYSGVGRYSNTHIVSLLITISIVGAIIQMLIIRKSFLVSQERALERSREASEIHAEARRRANLYGNQHQIQVLLEAVEGRTVSSEVSPLLSGTETHQKSSADSLNSPLDNSAVKSPQVSANPPSPQPESPPMSHNPSNS